MKARLSTAMTAALICGTAVLTAQMPDWKFFRDREGNTYFFDRAGKIRVIDAARRDRVIVSARGIDYYLHLGESLIRDHRPARGLAVLKSILALDEDNNRVRQAQVSARRLADAMKRDHGTRFDALDDDATPFLVRREGGVEAIDDRMRYSFRAPEDIAVLRKRTRAGPGYRYVGVLYGMKKKGADDGSYDVMAAVDSEEFSVPLRDLAAAEERWRHLIGPESVTREVVERSEGRVTRLFRGGADAPFAGLEGVFVNGRLTHCVRLISSVRVFEERGDMLRGIMRDFRVVSAGR